MVDEQDAVHFCECNCGEITKRKPNGTWNRYVNHHANRADDFHTRGRGLPPDCQCGFCDQKVRWNKSNLCWNKYAHGHNRAKYQQEHTPKKLCMCGCGETVTQWDSRRVDWFKYIEGHKELATRPIGDAPVCACGCNMPVEWRGGSWNEYYGRHGSRTVGFRECANAPQHLCKCGCGETPGLNNKGLQRLYMEGHNHLRLLRSFNKGDPKLCGCGCGESAEWDLRKGDWLVYAKGHQHNNSVRSTASIIPPMCKCACGQRVDRKTGTGAWFMYVVGHEGAGKQRPPIGAIAPSCACGCTQPVTWHVGDQSWNTYILGHAIKMPAARTRNSERMLRLWATDDEYIAKQKEAKALLFADEEYLQRLRDAHSTPEFCNAQRKRWQDKEFVQKVMDGRETRPNKPEQLLIDLLPDNVRYTGDGSWWRTITLRLPNGEYITKHKNPDFKITGQNKVIEFWGTYWHRGEFPEDLIDAFAREGIDCMVIWEHDFNNDRSAVMAEALAFIGSEADVA